MDEDECTENEEILYGKLHFFCAQSQSQSQSHLNGFLVKKNKHSSTLLYSRAGFLLFVILQSHVTQNS